MSALSISKVVSALPGTLVADTIYMVRVGTGIDIYVTNSSGTIVAYKTNSDINATALGTRMTTAETNIGLKAAKGANSDITSLTGLTTPLSISQGGTGGITAAAAKTALGIPFGKEFISAELSIAAGGSSAIPHGLGSIPKLVYLSLVCKVAEYGYTVGQEAALTGGILVGIDAGTNFGAQTAIDATNITIKYGNVGVGILSMVNGQGVQVTNTSWRLIVRAWG